MDIMTSVGLVFGTVVIATLMLLGGDLNIFVSDHGPTAPENLAMFCSRHHHLLHKSEWAATIEPDGTLHVKFPDGTVRTTRPPGRLC